MAFRPRSSLALRSHLENNLQFHHKHNSSIRSTSQETRLAPGRRYSLEEGVVTSEKADG